MDEIKLGQKVKDVVSGFEGIATSKHEYLSGETSYGIQGALLTDGKVPDLQYVDQKRLSVTGSGILPETTEAK